MCTQNPDHVHFCFLVIILEDEKTNTLETFYQFIIDGHNPYASTNKTEINLNTVNALINIFNRSE